MSIKTGRAEGNAQVSIDHEKCTLCGLCVEVCMGSPLKIKDDRVVVDQSILFGCIGCGHCAAVCPHECITIEGRTLSPDDFFDIPPKNERANYQQLLNLLTSRRSMRVFKDKPVEQEHIDNIVKAVSTAPMGLPPSDVEILIFNGRKRVQEFAEDMANLMYGFKWLFSPIGRTLMRPFFGKEFYESARTFIYPIAKLFKEEREQGNDWLFYDAPLVMYFHVSPYADPVDPFISATYAMLAAESLGLGACMIGTPGQFIKYSKKFKMKYGIPIKNHQGISVIFGYPAIKFRKCIKRSLGGVCYH